MPPELEPVFQHFDLSEPSIFPFDFPEDVGELLEHDDISADGDPGVRVIGRLGRSPPMPTSEILVELSVQAPEDSQHSPSYAPNILLPRIQEPSGDNDERGSFSHLRYLGSNVMDVPINVPLSPLVLMIDGFPDDTPPPYPDLVVLK